MTHHEQPLATAGTLVLSKLDMMYDGSPRAQGEVFAMTGARLDEKLLSLNYCWKWNPENPIFSCVHCERRFSSQDTLARHLAESHR